jgi:hypothetical protein
MTIKASLLTTKHPRTGYKVRAKKLPATLPERPMQVAKFLQKHPGAPRPRIAESLGIGMNSVSGAIHVLKGASLVEQVQLG